MIARKNRFHGYGSLKYVYQNGKTIRSSFSALKYVANPKRKDYRLAVVVSKKVAKSAVTRNRIRRRVYEAFRITMPLNASSHDMVVTIFNEQLANLPPHDLTSLVHTQLKQAGIITDPSQ